MDDAVAHPIRIEPALDDRERVHALFFDHAPYRAAAAYLPDGSDEDGEPRAADAVLPWFRGNWARGGEPLVAGVESLLHDDRLIAGAQALFPRRRIVPKTIVVNANAPMPAGVPHVDVPSFRGATREHLALRLLIAMGASHLFEHWRIVEAGAICWFYDGPGGNFDYWPDGLERAMVSERAPFGNVAIVADSDRMYHRIGEVGRPGEALPRMTAAAELHASDDVWTIVDGGEVRARYPRERVRLSLLWKAEATSPEDEQDVLTPPQIASILEADLAKRGVTREASLVDDAWISLVYSTYTRRR